jgi:membrane protein
MVDLWSLGGLGWKDLARRTWRESWQDQVFGQAARLSFYHFLALFPSLLLLLMFLGRLAGPGAALRDTLVGSFAQILPGDASGVVARTIRQLSAGPARGTSTAFAIGGAVWAALNGTWAMMVGLNTAYEVKEERPWWRILLTAAGLTLALGVLGLAALATMLYGAQIGHWLGNAAGIHEGFAFFWRVVHWPVVIVLLLVAFALLYRFGPNLYDVSIRWSTPGAALAVGLWLAFTVVFRLWFDHVHSYSQIYGPLASVAILLLWFYFTSAAILIGGEMNSEIENAAAQAGHPDARMPGEQRPGGNRRG